MDLTPQAVKEEKEEGANDGGGDTAAAEAEALNLRVAALVDTTSTTVFSYICQAGPPPTQLAAPLQALQPDCTTPLAADACMRRLSWWPPRTWLHPADSVQQSTAASHTAVPIPVVWTGRSSWAAGCGLALLGAGVAAPAAQASQAQSASQCCGLMRQVSGLNAWRGAGPVRAAPADVCRPAVHDGAPEAGRAAPAEAGLPAQGAPQGAVPRQPRA